MDIYILILLSWKIDFYNTFRAISGIFELSLSTLLEYESCVLVELGLNNLL